MKALEGKVVSVKQQNTVVVEVSRKTPHPLYKKLVTSTKRYQVDTDGKTVVLDDKVKITGTRHVSKTKSFKVMEVMK